jgi:hypothetical protein
MNLNLMLKCILSSRGLSWKIRNIERQTMAGLTNSGTEGMCKKAEKAESRHYLGTCLGETDEDHDNPHSRVYVPAEIRT